MFYFLTQFQDSFSFLNIFRYITFRAGMAAVTTFLLCMILGPLFIKASRRRNLQERNKREDAPGLDKNSIWVVYSVNQEDIWVSRIPVPILAEVRNPVHDTFDAMPPGPRVPHWNTYAPSWASVRIARAKDSANQYLELEDREASDYARAIRTFPSSSAVEISSRLAAARNDHGRLEVELLGEQGARPVRLVLNDRGQILGGGDPNTALETYQPGAWMDFKIKVGSGRFTILLNGKTVVKDAKFVQPSSTVYALSFRTGEFRGKPLSVANQREDLPGTEEPLPPTVYHIDDVTT